jgi:hypothetical protein
MALHRIRTSAHEVAKSGTCALSSQAPTFVERALEGTVHMPELHTKTGLHTGTEQDFTFLVSKLLHCYFAVAGHAWVQQADTGL